MYCGNCIISCLPNIPCDDKSPEEFNMILQSPGQPTSWKDDRLIMKLDYYLDNDFKDKIEGSNSKILSS